MTDPAERSLADDEAALAGYSLALIEAVEQIAPSWLRSLVDGRAPGLSAAHGDALDAAANAAIVDLRALLDHDIADQRTGPLEVLRRAVAVPNELLTDAGAVPPERDEFAQRNFPDDPYDLTPASFADIDQSLHEPGLVWGAAKAHVHLRRRREPAAESTTQTRVVALSVDLMDRSKISAAYPDAKLVRSVAKLVDAAPEADMALVDLARVDDPAMLAGLGIRVVAFGSHVDDEVLAAAEDAGAEAMARSVFFRRIAAADL